MAVYLVNVYSLSDDFIKDFPGIIIHQEHIYRKNIGLNILGKYILK